MADYTDFGYDHFLSRESTPTEQESALDPLGGYSTGISTSASEVRGGVLSSASGVTKLDLENDTFSVTDGGIERIRLGKLEDGTIGLLVKDKNGNVLLQFAGEINLLTSPQGNLVLDFNETQLLVKDDGGTPVILIGKQVGGF